MVGGSFEGTRQHILNNFEEELKPNRILYIELIATKDSEVGKGLATHLSQLACEHAHRTRGFCYAYVQVTHHVRNTFI
jgi:hypothetical protein